MRRCGGCGGQTTVIDTRPTPVMVLGGLVEGRRRRYACGACGQRFTSIEIPTEEGRRGGPLAVITGSAAERATAAFAALREFTTVPA